MQNIFNKTKELRRQGYNKKQAGLMAKVWAKGKSALHGPDQIAGGRADNITGLGDSRINSSIGSQWRSRVLMLDAYISEQAVHFSADTKLSELNIKLLLV